MNVKWIGAHTRNFNKGRQGNKVQLIILHWIVGPLKAADATFLNPKIRTSAHYGVNGYAIHQYIDEKDTAWHAGNYSINLKSIGIEHEGGPDLPVTEGTYKNSIKLVTDICRRYNIPADSTHIKRHRDIAPTQCPGTLDVERIIREVKKNLGGGETDMATKKVTILADKFTELVTMSDNWKVIGKYLKLDLLDKKGGNRAVEKYTSLIDELDGKQSTIDSLNGKVGQLTKENNKLSTQTDELLDDMTKSEGPSTTDRWTSRKLWLSILGVLIMIANRYGLQLSSEEIGAITALLLAFIGVEGVKDMGISQVFEGFKLRLAPETKK